MAGKPDAKKDRKRGNFASLENREEFVDGGADVLAISGDGEFELANVVRKAKQMQF